MVRIFGFCCREYHDIPCHYVPWGWAALDEAMTLPMLLIFWPVCKVLSLFEREE